MLNFVRLRGFALMSLLHEQSGGGDGGRRRRRLCSHQTSNIISLQVTTTATFSADRHEAGCSALTASSVFTQTDRSHEATSFKQLVQSSSADVL